MTKKHVQIDPSQVPPSPLEPPASHHQQSHDDNMDSVVVDLERKTNELSHLHQADEDSSFDWEHESNHEDDNRKKKNKTSRWTMLPRWFRMLFLMIIGGTALMSPVLALGFSYERFTERRQGLGWRNDEDFENNSALIIIMRFFCWLTFCWLLTIFLHYLMDGIPTIVVTSAKILSGACSERIKTNLEIYNGMRQYLKGFFITPFALGCFVFLFRSIERYGRWVTIFQQILGCLIIFTGIISLEKFTIQLIALRFHRKAYKDRLKEMKYALWVLDRLDRAQKRDNTLTGLANLTPFALIRKAKNRMDSMPPQESPTPSRASTFSDDNREKTKWFTLEYEDADVNSILYARKLAKKLFDALGSEREFLVVRDFHPYFDSQVEAEKAFRLFDKDNNGDITKREMRDCVIYIYKERKALMRALQDMSQVVGSLDRTLFVLALVIIAIGCAMIFTIDPLKSLVPLGTVFVGWSFIFGQSLRSLFESIIFLFVAHPIDAGDRVFIDEQNYLVEKVTLLNTELLRVDGQKVWVPNSVLMTKMIHNIRRSPDQAEAITFYVDFFTPESKIRQLEEKMRKFVADKSRDYHSSLDLNVRELENINKLTLTFWLQYKGNWQDGGRRFQRRTQFYYVLKRGITELEIHYNLPPQPVYVQHTNTLPGRSIHHAESLSTLRSQSPMGTPSME